MTEPPICVHDEEQSDGRQVWCSYCGTWLRDRETPAPMTAERLAELRSRITDEYACFDSMHRELLAEVVRLRTAEPEVCDQCGHLRAHHGTKYPDCRAVIFGHQCYCPRYKTASEHTT